MAEIALSRGLVTVVDDCDVTRLSGYSWSATPAFGKSGKLIGYYARTNLGKRNLYMHRFILFGLDAATGRMVDHVDRDKLNNRTDNLRECVASQNSANRLTARAGFRGVHKSRGLWFARIERLGVVRTRGCDGPESAARLYDEWAKELFGEFAVLNFPNEPSQITPRQR